MVANSYSLFKIKEEVQECYEKIEKIPLTITNLFEYNVLSFQKSLLGLIIASIDFFKKTKKPETLLKNMASYLYRMLSNLSILFQYWALSWKPFQEYILKSEELKVFIQSEKIDPLRLDQLIGYFTRPLADIIHYLSNILRWQYNNSF